MRGADMYIQDSEHGVDLISLGQAGFILKGDGLSLMIDPYLTDCVEREVGFKRLQPPYSAPEELFADVMLNTHSHLDHLDIDALNVFAARSDMSFIGAPDCEAAYRSAGIDSERYCILSTGNSTSIGGRAEVRAVYADHGNLAPEAIGFFVVFDGVNIYNVGDSGLDIERITASLGYVTVDVMIAPINGAYGNLNAIEACVLAARIRPRILIGCHFGVFVEHGGDPGTFLAESRRLGLDGRIMVPGDSLHIDKIDH